LNEVWLSISTRRRWRTLALSSTMSMPGIRS
jgi:hypothetical protein